MFKIVVPLEVRKIVFHRASFQFSGKFIVLCEKESECGTASPPELDHGFEKHEVLLHTIGHSVFAHELVVASNVDCEQNSASIFEATFPIFALTSPTTNVIYKIFLAWDLKGCLQNPSGLDSRPKYVLICGYIAGTAKPDN